MPRTKDSGSVKGTVPSQWYLDMKAERDALRATLHELLPFARGNPVVLSKIHAALERYP